MKIIIYNYGSLYYNMYVIFFNMVILYLGNLEENVYSIVVKIMLQNCNTPKKRIYFLYTKCSFLFFCKACLILKLSDMCFCGILQICQL